MMATAPACTKSCDELPGDEKEALWPGGCQSGQSLLLSPSVTGIRRQAYQIQMFMWCLASILSIFFATRSAYISVQNSVIPIPKLCCFKISGRS